MTFDGGLSYWNELVYAYVPAQALGSEFKNSLQFDLPGEVADPRSPPGTTITGMADSFQAFGWFGCLVFFLIAFMHAASSLEGAEIPAMELAAQLAYILILTKAAMHTIYAPHRKWFLTPWVHMAAFLIPGLVMGAQTRRRLRTHGWKPIPKVRHYQTGTGATSSIHDGFTSMKLMRRPSRRASGIILGMFAIAGIFEFSLQFFWGFGNLSTYWKEDSQRSDTFSGQIRTSTVSETESSSIGF